MAMDHRGLRMRLTGAGCTSCGAAIPVDRIAVLADRGDLMFVELSCPACESRTLGVVIASGPDPDDPVLDVAAHPELDPATEARLAGRPPLDEADVVAMRRFLAAWEGDLRSLVRDRRDRRDRRGADR
jgi:hypothetical protein